MSNPLEPIIAAVSSVICGAVTTIAAAIVAVSPDLEAAFRSPAVAIMDDGRMRCFCIIGAVGGGLLTALIFTPPEHTGRAFAAKVGSSSLAGILFTPSFIHWQGWEPNIDTLLSTSAVIAMVSVGAIRMAIPLWEQWGKEKLRKFFGITDEKPTDPKP